MASNNSALKHGDKMEYCPVCGYFHWDEEIKKMNMTNFLAKNCPECKKGSTVLASYHENPTSFTGIMPLNARTASPTTYHRRRIL